MYWWSKQISFGCSQYLAEKSRGKGVVIKTKNPFCGLGEAKIHYIYRTMSLESPVFKGLVGQTNG
jgi:hypothetical protein